MSFGSIVSRLRGPVPLGSVLDGVCGGVKPTIIGLQRATVVHEPHQLTVPLLHVNADLGHHTDFAFDPVEELSLALPPGRERTSAHGVITADRATARPRA